MNKAVEAKELLLTIPPLKDRMEAVWAEHGCREPSHLCRWSEGYQGKLFAEKGLKRDPVNKKARPCAS